MRSLRNWKAYLDAYKISPIEVVEGFFEPGVLAVECQRHGRWNALKGLRNDHVPKLELITLFPMGMRYLPFNPKPASG